MRTFRYLEIGAAFSTSTSLLPLRSPSSSPSMSTLGTARATNVTVTPPNREIVRKGTSNPPQV